MKIEAAPMDAMYDEPIRVRLSEFPPLHSVTLRASAMDGRNRSWNSNGTFITGPDGALDLSDTTPRAGTYRSSDANGLLWSMQLAADVAERTPFAVTRPDTVRVRLSAEIDGVEAASVELRRRIVADGVVREEIRNDGIVATFFRHASGARPGVIVLGGSGGGLAEDQPALL